MRPVFLQNFQARTVCSLLGLAGFLAPLASPATESVRILEVPDYAWHAGCFGTATGNLMGYWDRRGFPDFYTGPTANGVAPLDSFGDHRGIEALWASEAGVDGRPLLQPGHMDNYYVSYESVSEDPYVLLGRPEHEPECIGDFIGLSQRKWADLGGECEGNIDAYAFNFFDRHGGLRENHTSIDDRGVAIPDIQSGLRAWTRSRGYDADTFSQLSDFNPDILPGTGFTFEDLRSEIDRGYPLLLFMQPFGRFSRTVFGRPGQNPAIHALLAYGYHVADDGTRYVRYRTSWASGDLQFSEWKADSWTPNGTLNLPLRGVIGYRPHPKIVAYSRTPSGLRLTWHGPLSVLRDDMADTEHIVHQYVVERTPSLDSPDWQPATEPVSDLEVELPGCCEGPAFFRVRLMEP